MIILGFRGFSEAIINGSSYTALYTTGIRNRLGIKGVSDAISTRISEVIPF